jgi:hypothetical protein
VEYRSDDEVRVIEEMDAVLRAASQRFSEGASAQESIDATNGAISLAVEMPAELFVRMSPQTMVSLLEVSTSDDRMLQKVAEALLIQADVFQAEGYLIEAGARREQASAVLEFIDPARAN